VAGNGSELGAGQPIQILADEGVDFSPIVGAIKPGGKENKNKLK
jgi:hypothetical protein